MFSANAAPASKSGSDDALSVLRTLTDAYARRPVRTVAVVANAPLAPSAERAALIDSCDLVFRINGFALDRAAGTAAAGTRADVVVFNRALRATPWFFRDYRDRLYLLVEPGRLHWEPATLPDWWPADLGFVTVPNREVTIPLSQELGIDSAEDARWATTGTMTAWIARLLYPQAQVHITGFSFIDDPDQTSWEHATGAPCVVGPEHVLARESELLRRWIASGSVIAHP
jgi:hypothetical protein